MDALHTDFDHLARFVPQEEAKQLQVAAKVATEAMYSPLLAGLDCSFEVRFAVLLRCVAMLRC